MAPKKKKGKEDDKKEELKIVDKEFYILQIEDLNRKIARLESKCTELETENEQVRSNMETLDVDRGDVISHLRRVLQKKVDEVSELTERIDALQLAKETEGGLYKEKIKYMENDFKLMHEQLTSEIKLLNGKLNSLEEFRAQREELMSKYEKLELNLEEQEKRHDQQLLDLEQSYLVRKERLKEEMEARLLKLSLDFQKATQMRIASTTQSVIRENIAVNNQLNVLVTEWKRMCEEIEALKNYNKNLIINQEINKREKRVVERKNIIQNEVIKKLSLEESDLKQRGAQLMTLRKHISMIECELSEAKRCERAAIENLGVAKQQLHALAVSYNELKVAQNKQQFHAFKLEAALTRATKVVKQVLQLSKAGESDEGTIMKRIELLKTLEELLDLEAAKKQLIIRESLSVETIGGGIRLNEKYKTGDLGIIPPKVDVSVSAERIQEPDQDMTWKEQEEVAEEEEDKEEAEIRKNQYIQTIEDMVVSASSVLKEILLLPIAKTRLMKEEVHERRGELLALLENTLDLSLLQTPRPLPLTSLETILLPEGLLESELKFPTDKDDMKEYSASSVNAPCTDESPDS